MILRSHTLRSFTRLAIWLAIFGFSATAALAPLGAQNPPPTKGVPPQDDIYVKQVTVPPLHGLTRDEAAASLATVGLQPNFEGNADGTVARQLPDAGKKVSPGSSVLLLLVATVPPPQPPQQPQTVLVPDVIKRNRDDAATILAQRGLTIGQIDGPATGIVAHQSPTPESPVPPGSTVTLQMVTPAIAHKVPPPAPFPPYKPVPPPQPGLWTLIGMLIVRNPIVSLIALTCLGAAALGIGRVLRPRPPPVCTLRTARAETTVRSAGPGHAKVALRMDLVHHKSVSYRAAEVAGLNSMRRGSR